MTGTSEMSHAMNLGNFESMIAFSTAYGERYNPSTPNLTVESLLKTEIEANNILAQVKIARTNFDNSINLRKTGFKEFKELAIQVAGTLAVSGVSLLAIKNSKNILKKIFGVTIQAIKKVELREIAKETYKPILNKTLSVHQQSFTNQLNDFDTLVALLRHEPNYNPKKGSLKVKHLQTTINTLNKLNTNAINNYIFYNKVLNARNNYFYAPETGMVAIAFNVRKYIKSAFGSTSKQFKLVKPLKFVNIKAN